MGASCEREVASAAAVSVYAASMRIVLFLAALLALLLAVIAVGSGKTDIQLGIAATCFVGAMVLFGQVAILSGQKAIGKALRDRQAP